MKKNLFPFEIKTRRRIFHYVCCRDCGAVSLAESDRLFSFQQRERYEKHNNRLGDFGYTEFLAEFIRCSFSFIPRCNCRHIVDYGCGPSAALTQLLSLISLRQHEGEVTRDRKVSDGLTSPCKRGGGDSFLEGVVDALASDLPSLPPVDKIVGWDPFFAGNAELQLGQADLVLCLEVAEHFEEPHEGFSRLATCCTVGGHVAVGTLPLPESMAIPDGFKGWWYKDDRTHVSFYTEKAMAACGASCCLKYLGKASPRIFMFRKVGDA